MADVNTPGLDAMAAKQKTPIQASTPGLDAMAARQNSGKTLLQEAAEREQAKQQAAAERSLRNKAEAKEKRDGRKLLRGLKQAEITGRVNNFVRDWAAQNAAVVKAINTRGQTVDSVQLPGIGAMELSSGKLLSGPLYAAPTSSVEFPMSSSGENCVGLNLYTKGQTVWVGAGNIAGFAPSQWQGGGDDALGKEVGGGLVYAWVEIDEDTGEIEDVGVGSIFGDLPNPTNTRFNIALGYAQAGRNNSWTVTNYDCGSVYATVCRNWFAAQPPLYGVSLTRCGCGSSY